MNIKDMELSSNKYDLTDNLRKYSTNTITVLDKLYEVLGKQGQLEKEVKECRDKLIEALNNNETSSEEIEEGFYKLDNIILQLSPDTFDIQTSIDAFENLKEEHENNVKFPGFGKKILKLLFGLERKKLRPKENYDNVGIKGFGTYLENGNEDWLDNIDNVYNSAFINLYKRNILDYLVRNNSIPTFKEILGKTFCMAIKNSILTELQKNRFNEDECKESFGVINDYLQEKGITLEPNESIKESFIEECKRRYPLAKNSCNHLFEIKTFKNEFINSISKNIEIEIEQVFENLYKDAIRLLNKKDIKRTFSSMCLVLSNILGKYEEFKNSNNWKSDMISLFFLAIADKFEEDHLKKLRKNENVNAIKQEKPIKENEELQTNKHNLFNTNKKATTLDKNTEEKFDKVVGIIGGNDEKRESMKRYLVNLYKKELPVNFSNFKKIFDIQEIPAKAEHIILDKIGMEFEAEEEIKETKKLKKTSGEGREIITESTTKNIEIENPVNYMIDHLKNMDYHFINENNFLEQANEFCINDSQKSILKNLLYNPRFGKVLLHKSGCKDIRVLPIGKTGWRILMVKIDNNIYIDGCYNHNDYEQRLDLIKKGKVKIKTLIS